MMTKAALRKEFLSKRMGLSDQEALEKNTRVTQRLQDLLEATTPEILHIFLPQSNKKEIDTWQIIRMIRNSFPETAIIAPYVVPGTKEMQHYLLEKEPNLVTNRWGIPEPDPMHSVRIDPIKINLILIPLLAFDTNGFRVGYGGGYYDRFLAQCSPKAQKIGLSFFEPVPEIANLDYFDIPMHACLTPEKIWTW